jgi:uncharacterized membrane protein YagU involved in acid resistance
MNAAPLRDPMLPHKHFMISALTIVPAAIIVRPDQSFMGFAGWVVGGGLLSALIDLDVYILVLLRAVREERLKPYRNLLAIFRYFRQFKDTLTETGVLKEGLISHIVFSSVIVILFYLFGKSYIIPVALAVASHIVCDLPNLARLSRKLRL